LVLLYDEHLVERAVKESLKCEIPSKQHVLNHLSRLCEAPRPPLLETPPALQLRLEPIADAGRYDGLRERTL
jgi:hypothetical protein